MPRCCTPIANEFTPCYASVLVASDIRETVSAIEQAPLQASVTAWCSSCNAPYLITGALDMFPCPSAHHAHLIVLSRKIAMSEDKDRNNV